MNTFITAATVATLVSTPAWAGRRSIKIDSTAGYTSTLGAGAAKNFCKVVGQGSSDPNAILQWSLATNADKTCLYAINPPGNWVNIGRHVVVNAKHGKVGFADPVHFAYQPSPGYSGKDSFVIEIDRRISESGEHARRVIAFDVSVTR